MFKLVCYYRVSTDKQNQSGLGLESQKAAALIYATVNHAQIAAEFTEIQSGRKDGRPQLAAAIAFARRIKGKLWFHKLDRISRRLSFIATLAESDLDFVINDQPSCSRLTLHILGAVAEVTRRLSRRRYRRASGRRTSQGWCAPLPEWHDGEQ